MNADALALLAQIAADVRALREAVEAARPRARALRFEDRAAMAKILPVLAAHFPGTFATWKLIDYAEARDALGANLRIVLGNRSAQQVGKLFARAADYDIDGLRLRRSGQDASGALWECVAIASP